MIVTVENIKKMIAKGQKVITEENVYPGEARSGLALITNNTEINSENIESLEKHGIKAIKVSFKKTVEETVSSEVQSTIVSSLSNLDVSKINVDEVVEGANKLVSNVINSIRQYSYDLTAYLIDQPDMPKHAYNIAAFAVALAKEYNRDKEPSEHVDQYAIAVASILSNIGLAVSENQILLDNMDIPTDLLNNKLTKVLPDALKTFNPEYVNLYSYGIIGNLFRAGNTPMSPSLVKQIVLYKDENEKKTGKLGVDMTTVNKRIKRSAEILKVAEKYESLLTFMMFDERGKKCAPGEIAGMMQYYGCNNELNGSLVNLFLREIPVFPVGTRVKLSNDEIALVTDANIIPPMYDRPIVRTMNGEYDLAVEKTITIKEICGLEYETIIEEILEQIKLEREEQHQSRRRL